MFDTMKTFRCDYDNKAFNIEAETKAEVVRKIGHTLARIQGPNRQPSLRELGIRSAVRSLRRFG